MSKMTMEREIGILERALEKYGAGPQTDIMIEEASELIKALCKHRRAIVAGASGVEISCMREDVLEECADVQIMLNQMALIYGDFTEQEIAKLERLEKRLGMEAET